MQNEFNMVLVEEDERFLAALSHVAIVAGVLVGPFCALVPGYIWFREHQKEPRPSAFVRFHAAQATIYQALGFSIVLSAAFVAFLLCFLFVGLLLVPLVVIAAVIFVGYGVFVAARVWKGVNMKYPFIGEDLVRRIH